MPSKNTVKNKSGKFVKLTKNLLLSNVYPKLIDEWDYLKNKNISLTKISYKSVKSVNWICKKNHTWRKYAFI